MKKQYLWETHVHTSESSGCGRASAKEIVEAYYKAGYQGVIITDHFLNGYSTASRTKPWRQRIETVFAGYQAAKRAGDALGIVVLPGVEYYVKGADFLVYGLPLSFYSDQSDLLSISIETFTTRVHEAGGFLSQAHPYREAPYIKGTVAKRWDLVDAIEVINGSHAVSQRIFDEKALELCVAHQLLQTAGSDAHSLDRVATAALCFERPVATEGAFLSALRTGEGKALRLRDINK